MADNGMWRLLCASLKLTAVAVTLAYMTWVKIKTGGTFHWPQIGLCSLFCICTFAEIAVIVVCAIKLHLNHKAAEVTIHTLTCVSFAPLPILEVGRQSHWELYLLTSMSSSSRGARTLRRIIIAAVNGCCLRLF